MSFFLRPLIFLLLLLPSLLSAQEFPEPLTPSKRVTYGNQQHTSRDAVFFSEKDSKGNLIVLGYTERDYSFSDILVMKLDSDLNLLWSDQMSWEGISYEYPIGLEIDAQDHVWVVSKNLVTNSQANFVVTRFSPSGEKLWEYKSPETVETSTLNMNQYLYTFDEEGYMNFSYVKGRDYGGTPTYFRLSPEGTAVDEYQRDHYFSKVSHTGDYYHAVQIRYSEELRRNELYFLKFNKEMEEEIQLQIPEVRYGGLMNSLYESNVNALTDSNDNYLLVAEALYNSESGARHTGIVKFSITPSGEIKYYHDVDRNLDKFLLDTRINDRNELLVLSNSVPITAVDEEPLLTLERFAEDGSLLFSSSSERIVGNMANLLEDRILVRTLQGNIAVFDYELNLLNEIAVTPAEEIFVPQDLHLLDDSPVLVGTTMAPRYEGSTFYSEENFLIRKFDSEGQVASFGYDGEGTSKFYNYSMIRDASGDILISADEFLGPNDPRRGGSRAPRITKVIRYSSEMEYLDEQVVDRDFELWQGFSGTYTTEEGDVYRYEVQEDRKNVDFFINDELQWTRKIDDNNERNHQINYSSRIDKEGNFIFSSSTFQYGSRLHRLTPQNEYSFVLTNETISVMTLLSNNWIFAVHLDFSVRIYSTDDLRLISNQQYEENFISVNGPYLTEKNNKVLMSIPHNNQVLVFDQYGRYEDRFQLEAPLAPSVSFFDDNDAFYSYHVIGGGVYLAHGHNWSRLAISRYDNLVKNFIGPMPSGDSDGDGVSDFIDECPDTPKGASVVATGCPRFQLPPDNFRVSTRAETCKGMKNGILLIAAMEDHSYIASVKGPGIETVIYFQNSLMRNGLPPGTYEVCISIEGEDGPRNCYELVVAEGKDLSVKTSQNGKTMAVQVNQGTAPFLVKINGVAAGSFYSSEFSVAVAPGDRVELSSALSCEGLLQLDLAPSPQLLSNPVNEVAELLLPSTGFSSIPLNIYDASGQLVHSCNYESRNAGPLLIDTSGLSPGIYYLRLELESAHTLKMIKQ